MLGVCKRTLIKARLAGAVNPRRVGRTYRWTDADLAAFRASRPQGLNPKRAAAILGVTPETLSKYRKAGRLAGTPSGGATRPRYVYDPADLEAFRA